MRKKIFLLTLMIFFSLAIFASGSTENTSKSAATSNPVDNLSDSEWIFITEEGNFEYRTRAVNEEQPPNAVGYRGKDEYGNLKTIYTQEEQNLFAGVMVKLADALDEITFRLVMAMHPFPNILFQLYDTSSFENSNGSYTLKSTGDKATISQFSTDNLLISNNFYKTNLNSNLRTDNNKWKVSIAEDPTTSGNTFQYKKWSLITVLFVTFFAAEMLFMTIYGYITGSTENVLKEVAKKAGITLALFLVVSALPFLVESMRYGFFKIAGTFYGNIAQSYYNGTALTTSLTDSGEVFQLPGSFIRQMRVFFSKITNTQGQSALTDAMGDAGDYGFFGKLAIWLILLIFRFFMFFAILKAGLHIAINVIEVYLLLGLTMILVPFSIFEPLQPVGAKCIMSLVSNVLECFILVVMVTCVVPSCVTVCSDLLDTVYANEKSNVIVSQLSITTTYTRYEPTNTSTGEVKLMPVEYSGTERTTKFITAPEYAMLILKVDYNEMNTTFGFAYILQSDSTSGESIPVTLTELSDAHNVDFVYSIPLDHHLTVDELKNPNYTKKGSDTFDIEDMIPESCYLYGQGKTCDVRSDVLKIIAYYTDALSAIFKSNKTFAGDTPQRIEFADLLISALNSNDAFKEAYSNIASLSLDEAQYAICTIDNFQQPQDYTYAEGTVQATQVTAVTFVGLLLFCFMSMYIPVFFVQQSTQITNSLMNGTAAMESFANAMGNMAKSVASGVKTIAVGTTKLVGSGFKMHNQHLANEANRSTAATNKDGGDNKASSPQSDLQNK